MKYAPSLRWILMAQLRWLIGLLLLVAGVLLVLGTTQPPPGGSTYDAAVIENYDADFVIDSDGDLHAAETLRVNLPPDKRGIFRYWDLYDPVDSSRRYQPLDVEITRDGRPETVKRLSEENGRYEVARAGREDEIIGPGVFTYVITYTIQDVLRDGPQAGTELDWLVIPEGWRMRAIQADISVTFPDRVEDVSCERREVTQTIPVGCEVSPDGRTVTAAVSNLDRFVPITMQASLPGFTYEQSSGVWWPTSLDFLLGNQAQTVTLILLAAGLALLLGIALTVITREQQPLPVMTYRPPDGLDPVSLRFLLDKQITDRALSASLMHLRSLGLVRIDIWPGDVLTVDGLAPWEAWSKLDPALQALGMKLNLAFPGGRLTIGAAFLDDARRLVDVQDDLPAQIPARLRARGLLRSDGLQSRIRQVVYGLTVTCILASFFLLVLDGFGVPPIAVLIPIAFVVGSAGVRFPHGNLRRTPEAFQVACEGAGLRQMLSTPSAENRFDFAVQQGVYTGQKLFEDYVAYAMAFDCADEWSEQCREVMAGSLGQVQRLDLSLSGSIGAARTAFQASQASAAGSGGGGRSSYSSGSRRRSSSRSRGRSGGGGGGGSW